MEYANGLYNNGLHGDSPFTADAPTRQTIAAIARICAGRHGSGSLRIRNQHSGVHYFQISGMELSIKAAPIIEEILKALPVLFFAILVTDEKKQILQLSMAVGIGFAILENAFLLITYVDQVNIGWAIVRGVSTSLSHGICSMIVGCGIIFVRKQKKLFYTGTFALLSAAMTLHALFNLLIQSPYDYVALALPIVIYSIFWIIKLSSAQRKISAK